MPRKNHHKQPPRKRVYFKLTVPEAEEVKLLGSFDNWDAAGRSLKKDKKGIWKTWLMLELGTHEYRFLVDGQWQNDPGAEVVLNPYGTQNCVQLVG